MLDLAATVLAGCLLFAAALILVPRLAAWDERRFAREAQQWREQDRWYEAERAQRRFIGSLRDSGEQWSVEAGED